MMTRVSSAYFMATNFKIHSVHWNYVKLHFLLQTGPRLNLGINPLKTKRRLLYLKTQFVPRSKHFSSRL